MAVALQTPALFGLEGELVDVRVAVDPRHLEDILETLAGLDFPVNPELLHNTGSVTVEFPAYRSNVKQICEALAIAGFDPGAITVVNLWEQVAGPG